MKIIEDNKCIVKAGRGAFRKARLLSISNLAKFGNNNCINVHVISKKNKILYIVYVFESGTQGIMYESDYIRGKFRVFKLSIDYLNRKTSAPKPPKGLLNDQTLRN